MRDALHQPLGDPDPRVRVIALRDLAVAALGVHPGVTWLFEGHPALLGASPAAAAWYSARLARLAAELVSAGRPRGGHGLV